MNATLRLIRFHKPVGTLLLWYPTAWALWLANQQTPPFLIVLYFFFGTFLMRSAGCIINDIADRNIDKHVTRTKLRPLTAGEITLRYAFLILFTFLLLAFLVLIQLPKGCFYEALFALAITTVYPFCKRFLSAPQLILGIAFSMGIPMAYTALNIELNQITGILFTLNFFWILAYDTLYAMADRPDDLRIGIKSTAILFGSYWHLIIMGCLTIVSVLWIVIGLKCHFSYHFYIIFTMATMLLVIQNIRLSQTAHANYTQAFTTQSFYGLLMWLALITQTH